MVGEIRDLETAEMAIQAALTGHLVLSTLHTNDAAVCEACKERTTLSKEQVVALGLTLPEDGTAPQLPVWFGKGCVECRHTGLRGRSGVFEVLPIDDRIRRHVIEGSPATDIVRTARQDGMKTLREAAIRKLAQGVTSFEEVLRVTAE
jgi:general secretion pathway protein E